MVAVVVVVEVVVFVVFVVVDPRILAGTFITVGLATSVMVLSPKDNKTC